MPGPSPGAPPSSPFRFGERPRPGATDPAKTLLVTPPGRKRRRWLRLLGLLLVALLLLLGFSVASSFAGLISPSRIWMLAAGLVAAILFPAILASWGRALLRRRNRQGPGTLAALVAFNLLFLLGAALFASTATRRALDQHGSWWVAGIAELLGKDAKKNPVVLEAGAFFRWLGDRLPGAPVRPEPKLAETPPLVRDDGRVARRPDAGVAALQADLGVKRDSGVPAVAGEVRVAFERKGSAIVVPVTLHGAGGQQLKAHMLFDTGASISTIDEKTLRALGQMLPGDAPTVEVRTANGVVRRALTVIEGVELPGAPVRGGVTVSLCEPCASGESVGLLGLNVSRHFTVTLDHEAGQLILRRRALTGGGKVVDIQPFVELGEAKGSWRGPLLTIECVVQSRSPRALRNLRIAATVKADGREGKIYGELKALPSRGRQALTLQGLPPVKSASFSLQLEQAEW